MKTRIILSLIFLSITTPALSKAIRDFPASIVELTIKSSGKRMSGLAYLAAGEGPHPTALLLHGYPGNEKNLDVAQAMRRGGWNVVFFHYRGSWGSEGSFSFLNAEDDVQAVLNYMQEPDNAKALRVDIEKISTIGHSMGGHMAVAGLLNDPSLKCAVAYDGANLGANGDGLFSTPESAKLWKDYSDTLFMLDGWSGDKAIKEVKEFGKHLDLVTRSKYVAGRPILLIAANTDVIPVEQHIKPLYEAIKNNGSKKTKYLLIEDDHSFSSSRLELIDATAEFLDTNCR